ncbi:MAG: twin-arginine translocation pathway signal [Massilia sp.]|nr:twin-arginine translocation pathway signal [Massilia sp.]
MARYDFYFTRLMYESGDWDVDIRMPSNVLNSLVEYTTLKVDPAERMVQLADPKVLESPFCYLAGHKLVQFTLEERKNFERYVCGGGFVFVDDCNHDVDGLFAKSFEAEMAKIFGASALRKIPNNHPVYSSFFKFDGPPNTSVELNGWGDDLVHEYLKAIEIGGRVRVLYSNKDYGCEWDYDFRNKRFLAVDNTRFAVNIIQYALGA